jgi:O-antigen/teichoic acid export membrane protein
MSDELGTSWLAKRERSMPEGARAVALVSAATLVSAASAWGTLVLAARSLGPGGYPQFLVFWGLLFAGLGTAVGSFNETVRAVTATKEPPRRRRCRPALASLAIGAALGGSILGSAALWGPRVFGDDPAVRVLAVALGTALFTVLAAVNGALGGTGRWGVYASMLTGEGVARLVLTALALAVWRTVDSAAVATAAAPLILLPALGLSRTVRATTKVRADSSCTEFVRDSAWTMAGTGVTALLVGGFPFLVAVANPSRVDEEVGVLITGAMVTRAPLLVPIAAVQGLIIRRFVQRPETIVRSASQLIGWTTGATCVAAFAFYLVGPGLVMAIFGSGFEVEASVLSLLVFGAGAIATMVITGAVAVARARQMLFAGGWLVAIAVTVLLLALPLSATVSIVLALIVAPLTGVAVHVTGLLISRVP